MRKHETGFYFEWTIIVLGGVALVLIVEEVVLQLSLLFR